MKKILVTGRPGVGKTTLIKRAADILKERAGGFYTEEIKGEVVRGRSGFRIITLDGKRGVLAKVGLKSQFNVGLYGVNVKDLEEIGVCSISDAIENKEWVLIDEIGKMEEFSPKFKKAVLDAFDSPKNLLVTIREHDSDFTVEIKARTDITVIRLSFPDRDKIYSQIEKLIA